MLGYISANRVEIIFPSNPTSIPPSPFPHTTNQLPTMPKKPTILLIPGAWHQGDTFSPVAHILRVQGYQAETITLPSAGGPTSTTAYDDAKYIRKTHLNNLVAQGKEVIIVMHSYSGIPGTECVKGFARRDLATQGKNGGVVSLIYLSAFIVPAGASIQPFLPGGLDSFMTMDVSSVAAQP